jgi:hypothetical protein
MTEFPKPMVRRQKYPRFGFFGPEYWWDIYVGWTPIASAATWRDAMVIARLAAVGLARLTERKTDE